MQFTMLNNGDGPTSIFLAGKLGFNWFNFFGLMIVVLMLIPNVIYALRFRNSENKCKNKWINGLEQVGRYASMFFVIFPIGVQGFDSVLAFLCFVFGNAILLLSYWIIWILYFGKRCKVYGMLLAVIPTLIFFISGITMVNYLLIGCSLLFGVCHIYVTWLNYKEA